MNLPETRKEQSGGVNSNPLFFPVLTAGTVLSAFFNWEIVTAFFGCFPDYSLLSTKQLELKKQQNPVLAFLKLCNVLLDLQGLQAILIWPCLSRTLFPVMVC